MTYIDADTQIILNDRAQLRLKLSDAEGLILSQNKKLAEYEKTLLDLTKQISQLKSDQESLFLRHVEFDIENTDVFVVDYDYEEKKTTIGYVNAKGKTEEWYTKCTIKQHNNFVKRLKNKVNNEKV